MNDCHQEYLKAINTTNTTVILMAMINQGLVVTACPSIIIPLSKKVVKKGISQIR